MRYNIIIYSYLDHTVLIEQNKNATLICVDCHRWSFPPMPTYKAKEIVKDYICNHDF